MLVERKKPDVVVLALPAMTLNWTEFPDFETPTLHASYRALVEPMRDTLARSLGLQPYTHGLEQWLRRNRLWLAARRRIVVAHSFGAMLALQWLCERPRPHVDGLVAISATAGPMFRRVHLRLGEHVRVPVAPLIPLWNTRLVTRICKRIFSNGRLTAAPVDFRALRPPNDARVDRAGWRNVEWQQLRAMRLALSGFDMRDRLHRFGSDCIVLHGDHDSLFEVEDARYLASAIPGAELRIVQGAGHALPVSHPEAVTRAVHDLVTGARHAKASRAWQSSM